MQPTTEQQNILNAKGRVVKINARAGTGKTATLLMIAESNPDKKILYLVFNSRNRQEAKAKFPGNVDIHTIHSFALSTYKGQFDGFDSIRPSHFLSHFSMNREMLSTLAQMYLVFFLNSPYPKLQDAIDPFKRNISEELLPIFEKYNKRIVEVCRESLTNWYKNKKNCPHDFYLKLSHRENKFQDKLNKYDLVLIDEGQDLSPIMTDALSTISARIILVGDTHQQIYSFRYAEDAMINFIHDELYDLTLSFRFGRDIAQLTSQFICNGKNDSDFNISGNPGISSRVYFYDRASSVKHDHNTAILCRTNFSLFKNAMYLRARKERFCFERDITPELYRTLDVYWLSVGEQDKIKDELIRSFDSLKDLETYAETMDDFQLLNMIDLIKTYESHFPGIVYELLKLCKEKGESQHNGAVTLSTIHASKGQEYETVIIDDDVVSRIDGRGSQEYLEEINVAYVGITRAQRYLYLPAGMRTLFNERWRDYVKQIPDIKDDYVRGRDNRQYDSRHGHTSKGKDTYTPSKTKQNDSPPEIRVGDKVRSPNGYGIVVQIDGDRYLIALENQAARVWERRSAIVKVQVLPASGSFKRSGGSRYGRY